MADIQTERKFLLLIIIAVAIFGGLFFAWNSMKEPQITAPNPGNGTGNGNGVVQEIYLKALSSGNYDKGEITVKKGIPVRLHFSAEPGAGCGRALIISKFKVSLVSKNGEEQIAQFTPAQEGTFEYSCSMRMFTGKLKVAP